MCVCRRWNFITEILFILEVQSYLLIHSEQFPQSVYFPTAPSAARQEFSSDKNRSRSRFSFPSIYARACLLRYECLDQENSVRIWREKYCYSIYQLTSGKTARRGGETFHEQRNLGRGGKEVKGGWWRSKPEKDERKLLQRNRSYQLTRRFIRVTINRTFEHFLRITEEKSYTWDTNY